MSVVAIVLAWPKDAKDDSRPSMGIVEARNAKLAEIGILRGICSMQQRTGIPDYRFTVLQVRPREPRVGDTVLHSPVCLN